MAIDYYVGAPGSGKSYQVVTKVIYEALAQGRRVVTNIRGVNFQLIYDAIPDPKPPLKNNVLFDVKSGKIYIDESEIKEHEFFCSENNENETILKGGELLVIDEAYKLHRKGQRISDYVLEYYRSHRHYVDENGLTTEIVLITQDTDDLQKELKAVVDFTYKAINLLELGIKTHYNIDIYKGVPLYRDKPVRQIINEKYDPQKFAWYKSHTVEGAKQVKVDQRGNMFKSKFLLFKLLGAPLLMVGCGYYAYITIKDPTKITNTKPEPIKQETSKTADPALQSQTQQQVIKPSPEQPQKQDTWYITGYAKIDTKTIVYITNGKENDYLINPELKFNGRHITAKRDNEWITNTKHQSSSLLPL